jgi:hypothetical protein
MLQTHRRLGGVLASDVLAEPSSKQPHERVHAAHPGSGAGSCRRLPGQRWLEPRG